MAAACTNPDIFLRLFRTTFRTEIPRILCCATAAGPACPSGCLCLRLLLRRHLKELPCIHAAGLICQIHPCKSHHGTCIGVCRCRLHGFCLCIDQMRRRHGGIAERCISLQLLNHGFILIGCLHAAYTDRGNLNAISAAPFFRKHLIQRLRKLHGMCRQGTVTDTHSGKLAEGRLQGCQHFAFQLRFHAVSGICIRNIAADVLIEKNGVDDMIRIFAMTANCNINIQTDIRINHTERHRI